MHGLLPFSPVVQQGDGRLMLAGAREEFPCHMYAIHALQVAVGRGMRWIRVHKRGHACEYDVNALLAHCQKTSWDVPRAIIYTEAEHEAVGNWTDPGHEMWPGFGIGELQRRSGVPSGQVPDGERGL